MRIGLKLFFYFLFIWQSSAQADIVDRVIHAGETPLASSCTVSLTGPMQLTISGCSFTTTGYYHTVPANKAPANVHGLIASGKAEKLADGRIKVWLQNKDGTVFEKSRTIILSSDVAINIPILPEAAWHRITLGVSASVGSVVAQSWTATTRRWLPDPPVGWEPIHILMLEFLVPAFQNNLNNITIQAIKILPGFPPGSLPDDFKMQTEP